MPLQVKSVACGIAVDFWQVMLISCEILHERAIKSSLVHKHEIVFKLSATCGGPLLKYDGIYCVLYFSDHKAHLKAFSFHKNWRCVV